MIICIVYVVLLLSMIGWLSWWWNEIWYVRPLKARCSASNAKLPLGHLGFPLLGETLSLLWLFNIVSRPHDFITFKRHNSHIDAIEKLFQGIIYGFRAQPWNLPGTAYHHALKCRKKITKKLKEELEKRKQKNNDSVSGENTINDLMDGLMQMKNEEQRHLSDEEVLDNVVSTILVGHISIAYAITWSLQFLANNPNVLLKLREENKAMFKKNNNENITYEDISKLKYTNKVAEETIRMANLSSFVFRKATDDIVFKGYLIPKGWSVLVWLRSLHNDPTNFEDPMSFNPDRWDNARPKQGTYHPFGGGSRSCAGSALVRVSLALFLHHLSIGYKWELLNPDAKVKYLSHPLPRDGLEISISKV